MFGSASFAAIDAEMEGMEAVSRDDGTFLVGGPTYQFDRILGAGGLHSESELWTPQVAPALAFQSYVGVAFVGSVRAFCMDKDG